MEWLSAEFFTALGAIILIDLVLAGDNAIVIALAARNLPEHLRKRAIVWGAAGAVVVRSLMTLAVVWLLKIPGLLAAGGLLLFWIAYKLLVDDGGADEGKIAGSNTFIGAMKTIVVADAIMGIDNVLAVAGAAHGSYVLVVLGLLISIPIVVWGSSMLLKFTECFPSIVYLGAGVLAWTAAKMTLSEPLVRGALPDSTALVVAIYVLAIAAVLGAGWLRKNGEVMRAAIRKHAKVRHAFRQAAARGAPAAQSTATGGVAMEKVLVPVDGSENALAAVREAANAVRKLGDAGRVVLLNVRPPFPRHVARFAGMAERRAHHEERAAHALAAAKAELERRGVAFESHYVLGPKADSIAAFATDHGCDRIIIGTARKNSLTRLVQNSVVARLLDRATVPVNVVVGSTASAWERFGVPAGVAAVLAMVMVAAD